MAVMELSTVLDRGAELHLQVAGSISLESFLDGRDPFSEQYGQEIYERDVLLDMREMAEHILQKQGVYPAKVIGWCKIGRAIVVDADMFMFRSGVCAGTCHQQ